jgi:hypothetical protein
LFYSGSARNSDEALQALHLACLTFDSPVLPLKRKELLLRHPGYSDKSPIIVSNSSGEVLASLFLVDCLVRLNQKFVQGVFLSSISVRESHRGLGLSTLLINAALSTACSRSKKVALVIARKAVDHFYTRFGFWGISHYCKFSYSETPSPVCPSTDLLKFVPASSQHFPKCQHFYNLNYSMSSGSCARPLKYWSYILYKCLAQEHRFDMLVYDNEPIGYVIHDSSGNVFEIATSLCHPALNIALFLDRCGMSNGFQVLHIHPLHPFISYLDGTDFTLSLRECRHGGHMLKTLHDIDPILSNNTESNCLQGMSYSDVMNTLSIPRLTSMVYNPVIEVSSSFNIPLMDQI